MAHNNDPNATPPPRPASQSRPPIPPYSSGSPPVIPPMPPIPTQNQPPPRQPISAFPTATDYKFDLKDENGKLLGKAKVKTITSGTTSVPILYVSPKRWYTKKDKWHTYLHKTDSPTSDLVWKIDKSKGGNEQLLKVKPFWMTAYRERKLTDMYLLLAKRKELLNSTECNDLVERANSNDFGRTGRKLRTGVAAGSMIVAAGAIAANEVWQHSLGKLVEQYFGHTVTNNIPGETVKVPPTAQDIKNASHAKLIKEVYTDLGALVNASEDLKIFKHYSGATDTNISDLSMLSAKIKINKPMWTTYQTALKAMGKTEAGLYSLPISEIVKLGNQIGYTEGLTDAHGLLYNQLKIALNDTKINLSQYAEPTLEHLLALEDLAIKDPTADLLWDNYAADLKANHSVTIKDDLYVKTPIQLAQLADTLAKEKGGLAWQAVINLHSTYLATAKSVISDNAFTDAEIDAIWGNASLDNIVKLDQKITLTPEINSIFSDTYVADYFSHTGFTMKAAYNATDLQSKVQAGIGYKYDAIYFENDLTASKLLNMTGNTREDGIAKLVKFADYKDQSGNSVLTTNYNLTIDRGLYNTIIGNETYANTSLGKALIGAYNLRGNASSVEAQVFQTKDGAMAQFYRDGKILASETDDNKALGVVNGGGQGSKQEYTLFEKFKK